MLERIDCKEGSKAVFQALRVIDALRSIDDKTLHSMIETAMQEDLSFMRRSGVEDSQPYDEDLAFVAITKALRKSFPKQGKWLNIFTDDYMEAWEVYLDSAGFIEWE